jgi:hypothetical protein
VAKSSVRSRRARASAPIGGSPRRRGHLRLLKGLLALVIAFFVIEIAVNPWTFHIGDRFTPLMTWDGYGTVQASNGGHYLLFTRLQGAALDSACSFTGCQTLRGSAQICTERGSTYTFQLVGSVHAWWSTDGAKTSIDLRNVKSGPLPRGWVISLAGSWHGPRLVVADTGNSFTGVLTPRGVIRHAASTAGAGHATSTARAGQASSTAHAGQASVTLRYGSSAAFSQACRALAA